MPFCEYYLGTPRFRQFENTRGLTVREMLSAADELVRVETGDERETCHDVELEALVSHMRRVRRHVEFECGVGLGYVTFACKQRPYKLEDGLGTYHMGLYDIYR